MSDMQCPYCGADQEVCHDDGAGYSEDERHALYTEQQVRALLAEAKAKKKGEKK